MSESPVSFRDLLQLTSLGINPAAIGFATLTMEADNYICVRDQGADSVMLTIVDVRNPSNVVKRPVKQADSAMMSPVSNILALKADLQIQVFDLDKKEKVSDCTMTEAVEFWRWLSPSQIALVTPTAVYHWGVTEGRGPQRIFERHASLAGAQIIGYRVNAALTWGCLVGIAKQGERIAGQMQLYSTEKRISQPLEGHACCFTPYKNDDGSEATLFAFAVRSANGGAKLGISEITTTGKYTKKATDIFFPPEAAQDFPVAMQISQKYNMVYVVTKVGFLHMFDIATGKLVFMNRISADPIFASCPQPSTGGMIAISRRGQVISVTVDEANVVRYVAQKLQDFSLALSIAVKNQLPGAEGMFQQQFQQLVQQGKYADAARVAADSPRGFLRTMDTIRLFQSLPTPPGERTPLLQYFNVLLERGRLNAMEALELTRPVLQQGRKELLENWLKEDKLECSEELGDMVHPFDVKLALSIYYRANAVSKVVASLVDSGQFDSIIPYATKVGHHPDYEALLARLLSSPSGVAAAASFAAKLLSNTPEPLMAPQRAFDLFMARNCVQEATTLVYELLRENKPEHGALQTAVLEANLQAAPQVADAFLTSRVFAHYNRQQIALACEQRGLFQRALEQFTEMKDIRRVLVRDAASLPPDYVVRYMAPMPAAEKLGILKELVQANARQNTQLVVAIASKNEDILPQAVIDLLENSGHLEGLFYYLSVLVTTSQDPDVLQHYLETAAKLGHFHLVEKCVRESSAYDPARVRDFLMSAALPDPTSLIIVCDRHDMVPAMATYLYRNNMGQALEAYVAQVAPAKAPMVVGALMDADAGEEFVRRVTMSARNLCPVKPLIEVARAHERLRWIQPWLEARAQEGNSDTELHNALAMIYVESGNSAEEFLRANPYYQSDVVGAYCEKTEPTLAILAYRRGRCDGPLVAVATKHSLWKPLARYLVERQNAELWATVLTPNNPHLAELVQEVIHTAIPECSSSDKATVDKTNADKVSATVKAFIAADLPKERMALLEQIVFESSEFGSNRYLQNLLLITAIEQKERVMDLVQRLDHFDGAQLAAMAVSQELFEEALAIYRKFKMEVQAVEVLLYHLNDHARAIELADRLESKECYAKLAKALLIAGRVSDAIKYYVLAGVADDFADVADAARKANLWEELIRYLKMCRGVRREAEVDAELLYAYAKTQRVREMEEMLAGAHVARVSTVGERCFEEGLLEAARALFSAAGAFARLAATQVRLGQYTAAVEAARKANAPRTWKEVAACLLDRGEHRLAQVCALSVVHLPDSLEDIVREYEQRGLFEELVGLLEAALGLEAAGAGVFTELAVQYSRHQESKLDHCLRLYAPRMQAPRALRALEKNRQWAEAAYLRDVCKEPDAAVAIYLEHPSAWTHERVLDALSRATNPETLFRAVQYYLEQRPALANDLLTALAPRLDAKRVVGLAVKLGLASLIRGYLLAIQSQNIPKVNEALHALFIEEEDSTALRDSLQRFDAYDPLDLAQALERHALSDFRRIAADLYRRVGRFDRAMTMLRQDAMYKDAIRTAAESRDPSAARSLLVFFAESSIPEGFVACLYACYDLLPPHDVLEIAWMHNLSHYAMPYLIQTMKDYSTTIQRFHLALQQPPSNPNPNQPRYF